MKTVQVYRLWLDHTWDLVAVEIEAPLGPDWNNVEIIEVRAVAKVWTALDAAGGAKPVQVGLYMASLDGVMPPAAG